MYREGHWPSNTMTLGDYSGKGLSDYLRARIDDPDYSFGYRVDPYERFNLFEESAKQNFREAIQLGFPVELAVMGNSPWTKNYQQGHITVGVGYQGEFAIIHDNWYITPSDYYVSWDAIYWTWFRLIRYMPPEMSGDISVSGRGWYECPDFAVVEDDHIVYHPPDITNSGTAEMAVLAYFDLYDDMCFDGDEIRIADKTYTVAAGATLTPPPVKLSVESFCDDLQKGYDILFRVSAKGRKEPDYKNNNEIFKFRYNYKKTELELSGTASTNKQKCYPRNKVPFTPPSVHNKGSMQVSVKQQLVLSKDNTIDDSDITISTKESKVNPFSTLIPPAIKFRINKNTEAGKYHLIFSVNTGAANSLPLITIKQIRIKKLKRKK